MKLIMTVLVRDEADVIRQNLDFHFSQGVDFVVAMDNLSVDGSTDILLEYERQGRLHYIKQTSDDFRQREWLTAMARIARVKFGADWVINNDSDEFWWPTKGTLKERFENLPKNITLVRAERSNFLYHVEEDEALPFYDRMTYRSLASWSTLGEPLPSKVAHAGSRWVKVGYGSHAVSRVWPKAAASDVAQILHFPMRTQDQFLNKISKGGAALTRNSTLAERDMQTWIRLYSSLTKDGNLDNYFNEHSYDTEKLEVGVDKGLIVEDRRFSEYFKRLYSS